MEARLVTPNSRITDTALGLLTGRTPEPRDKHGRVPSGLCLAQVRLIVEHALFGGAWRFYDWRTRIAEGRPPGVTDPWARDLEASLKAAGMALDLPRTGPPGDPTRYVDLRRAVPHLQPGDLVFRWDTARHSSGAFIGHVGVLVARDLVIENVDPAYRAKRTWNRGPTVLGPLTWPVTTVVRFDPDRPPA
jgi:hypothetical protein